MLIDRAYADDIDDAVAQELLASDNVQVAMALAANEHLSAAALKQVARTYPRLTDLASTNPSAPPTLKDRLPLGAHSGFSLERYLDDVGATREQRTRLFEAVDRAPAGAGPLLGDFWAGLTSQET
ncbi:hypothetical protein [Demequina activiva]|uniref:hypothetical protein n=1 Tax=Demequina activiva TaxID=1582364 RepID=UPI0019419799|nr:hypothetical protein [Demequina activiva]